MIEKAPKTAMKHFISAIRPAKVRSRLEQDLGFAHYHLTADFTGFMQHAFRVSQAFEILDVGPRKAHKVDEDGEKIKNPGGSSGSSSSKADMKGDDSKSKKTKKPPPGPCLLPKCKGKDRLHWISDCTLHDDAEKKKHREDIAAENTRDGPASSTRSKTAGDSGASK